MTDRSALEPRLDALRRKGEHLAHCAEHGAHSCGDSARCRMADGRCPATVAALEAVRQEWRRTVNPPAAAPRPRTESMFPNSAPTQQEPAGDVMMAAVELLRRELGAVEVPPDYAPRRRRR